MNFRKSVVFGMLAATTLSFSVSHAQEAVTTGVDNPVETLLLDPQTTTNLDSVDFVMQVSPQTVTANTVIDYYYQLQNTNAVAVENARLTHVLPRGFHFIGHDLLDANAIVETTNYPNDTLIVRGLYLSANMSEPMLINAQVAVDDFFEESSLTNQAVLDVVTSMGYDSVLSDANPTTTTVDEPTLVIIKPASVSIASVPVAQVATLAAQKPSAAVIKKATGGGRNALRWAGMKREEYLKPGATAAETKAYNDKINGGIKAEVKTYVDQYGKTKFYGITAGRLPVSRFANAVTKSRATYRGTTRTTTATATKAVTVTPKINDNMTRAQKLNLLRQNFKKTTTTTTTQ
jgi:hypothetical protein